MTTNKREAVLGGISPIYISIEKGEKLMGIGDDYHVLFLQGGASHQFAMCPMNFLGEGKTADYINTGTWSTKAIKEAKLFGNVNVAFDGNEVDFMRLPKQEELKLSDDAVYLPRQWQDRSTGPKPSLRE